MMPEHAKKMGMSKDMPAMEGGMGMANKGMGKGMPPKTMPPTAMKPTANPALAKLPAQAVAHGVRGTVPATKRGKK